MIHAVVKYQTFYKPFKLQLVFMRNSGKMKNSTTLWCVNYNGNSIAIIPLAKLVGSDVARFQRHLLIYIVDLSEASCTHISVYDKDL
jgi:hypothetical protein